MTPEGVTTEQAFDLFRSSKRSVFRLETLDRYNVVTEDEDYRRWARGDPPPPIEGLPWFELVREVTAAGVLWDRVHLIRLPLTDYLRFELEFGYVRMEQAGERCHILELPGDETLLPAVDFWLFDERVAIRMDYDQDGRVLERVLVTDPADIGGVRKSRAIALSRSTPFAEWLRQARDEGRI